MSATCLSHWPLRDHSSLVISQWLSNVTWKCVTTTICNTDVYPIWEIISLKALFKVKLSWQMQSFQTRWKPSDEVDSKICARESHTERISCRADFTDTSVHYLVSLCFCSTPYDTYRWELRSSFCVGVSIIFDSFIEVGDAGEWYA